MEKILDIKDLEVRFVTRRGIYHALNGVNLELYRGEVLGIAGESGSGKSTLALTITGLLPKNAWVKRGEILYNGRNIIQDLLNAGKDGYSKKRNEKAIKSLNKSLQNIRGSKISIVFQDPMTALNPVLQVGYQIAEAILYHNPSILAKRILARSNVTKDDLREIIKILKEKEEYQKKLIEFIESRNLEGLEEQILFIWERQDLHVAKKEKLILSLAEGEKISNFTKKLLLQVARSNRIPRIPILGRVIKRVLIREGYRKAIEMLSLLNVPNPEKVVYMYPHELSGGMRQRVVIAIALVNNPEIVLLDEPTSALDVTVQAQVLDLIRNLRRRYELSFIFISHDLSVLYEISDRIAIMYAGRVVEVGNKEEIISKPLHPYTQSLLRAVPSIDAKEISPIPGEVPDMRNPPKGCMFHPRCPYAMEICRNEAPTMYTLENNHKVACFLYGEKR
ncbi:MAG: ABC transporter ATP-binding protein [Sulfolobaceae archaeon]